MRLLSTSDNLNDIEIDRDTHGAKFVGLVDLGPHIDGGSDFFIPPAVTVQDEVMKSPFDYRTEISEVCDLITEDFDFPILIWARSNANHELDGVFNSVPIMFNPEKRQETSEQVMNALQEVTRSGESDTAKREIESFGLEGKIRLHGLIQAGGKQIQPGDAPKIYAAHDFTSDLLGIYGMTFYVYSHSFLNPRYIEIRCGFGLGEGIVGRDCNIIAYDRESKTPVIDQIWDGRHSQTQTFRQNRARAYDPSSREVIDVRLKDVMLDRFEAINIYNVYDHLDSLASLIKR